VTGHLQNSDYFGHPKLKLQTTHTNKRHTH